MNAKTHIQAIAAIAIINAVIALGPDPQFQAYIQAHLWAHLLYVVAANAWAAILPYVRPTFQQPDGPAKEQE